MNYMVRFVDAALLIGVGSLTTILLPIQGYQDAGTVPFFVGLVGAWIAWVNG